MEIFNYKFDDLFEPTLKALQVLGGSGSVQEIEETVIDLMNLSEEKVNDIHRGSITKLSYRLAWARNYLKKVDFIENSSRGVWVLTTKGANVTSIDKEEIKRVVRETDRSNAILESENEINEDFLVSENEELKEIDWQEEVLNIIKELAPEKFERLCQRLLRELGFVNVEVTGKSGDGGIDGKGVYKFGGIMSFHVVFQCKRYSGSVSSDKVRDFRGAFVGRADKGLLITTGVFTRDAKKEAQRDGAPPIDLIDGFELAEKLKEMSMGVDIEMIERVHVNKEWFYNF